MHRQGFTLVELSIVLVIIGVLIGGILVAQSMIETVKIQSFIRSIQQYDASLANFNTKYNQWPGDSNLFTPPGNNDGVIGAASVAQRDYITTLEAGYYWQHLSDSGFNPAGISFAGITAGTITPGVNIPKAGFLNGGIVMDGQAYFGLSGYYVVGDFSTGGGFAVPNLPIFTTAEALAIDTKIDDSLPGSGTVRAGPGQNSCYSGSVYTISQGSNVVCSLDISSFMNTSQQ